MNNEKKSLFYDTCTIGRCKKVQIASNELVKHLKFIILFFSKKKYKINLEDQCNSKENIGLESSKDLFIHFYI